MHAQWPLKIYEASDGFRGLYEDVVEHERELEISGRGQSVAYQRPGFRRSLMPRVCARGLPQAKTTGKTKGAKKIR